MARSDALQYFVGPAFSGPSTMRGTSWQSTRSPRWTLQRTKSCGPTLHVARARSRPLMHSMRTT